MRHECTNRGESIRVFVIDSWKAVALRPNRQSGEVGVPDLHTLREIAQ
jgi:hypothetical protein